MIDINVSVRRYYRSQLLIHQSFISQSVAYVMLSRIISLYLALLTAARLARSCALDADAFADGDLRRPTALQPDYSAIAKANVEYRDAQIGRPRAHATTAITNVAVFDGHGFSGPRMIMIKDGRIIDEDSWSREAPHEVIDGAGHTLLPGLIDSHFHPDTVAHLKEATRYGVTTGVVMACPDPQLCASLQGHIGLSRLMLASAPGAAVDSIHGRLMGLDYSTALGRISTPSVTEWVDKQVASGADIIKLIASTSGLDHNTLSAATTATHARGLQVACHATDYKSVQQALSAGGDQIHHVPLDKALDGNAISRFSAVSVPTLIMMRKTSKATPALHFSASVASIRALYQSGIIVLAGTDANAGGFAPGHPRLR
jgi:imidazolonepropionase-like amidohydrolase